MSDDNEGRVAGVVIYILESHVHGVAVVVLQYFNLISKGADSRLQQVKMNGRHLRTEKGVILFHLLGEHYAVIGAGHHPALKMSLVPYLYGCNEGADSYSGRSQVIDLVNL